MSIGALPSLSICAADDGHEFLDLPSLLGFAARGDRVLDAMADVIPQDLFLETPQGGSHSRNLGDDIDAIPVVLDHARKPSHLTLDASEAFGACRLDIASHA
jgi:hypothetical protein